MTQRALFFFISTLIVLLTLLNIYVTNFCFFEKGWEGHRETHEQARHTTLPVSKSNNPIPKSNHNVPPSLHTFLDAIGEERGERHGQTPSTTLPVSKSNQTVPQSHQNLPPSLHTFPDGMGRKKAGGGEFQSLNRSFDRLPCVQDLEDRALGAAPLHVVPVLFLIQGRSGSTVFIETVHKLVTGKAGAFLGMEILEGRENVRSLYKKKILGKPEWQHSYFCDQVQHAKKIANVNRNEGRVCSVLVGWKWMPFIGWDSASSDEEQYLNANRKALKWCVRHGISIVHMVRNPLDVLISRQKHASHKLTAHCTTSECTKKHLQSKSLLSEKNIVSDLKHSIRHNEQISQVLHGVKDLNFFTLSYEDTFGVHGDYRMVKTWNSLLHFLGQVNGTCFRPEQKLGVGKIRFAMSSSSLSTSAANQSDKVVNFPAIEKALRGAGLGEMVH